MFHNQRHFCGHTLSVASVAFSGKQRVDDGKMGEDYQGEIDTIPHEFLCPITQVLMEDPVTAAGGCCFSRVLRFLQRDPFTRSSFFPSFT